MSAPSASAIGLQQGRELRDFQNRQRLSREATKDATVAALTRKVRELAELTGLLACDLGACGMSGSQEEGVNARDEALRWLKTLGLALAVLLLGAFALPAHAAEDAYYPMPLAELVAKRPADRIHSHLCITGAVSRVRKEADGDFHVRLCDAGLCLVLEVIPELPLPRPKKGARIEACGVSRWDSWHLWWELHPVVRWREVGL